MSASGIESAPSRVGASTITRFMGHVLRNYALVVLLVLVVIAFTLANPDTYFTAANIRAIVQGQTTTLLLALAVLVPLTVGTFDLSVATIFGFCQLLVVGLLSRSGLSPAVAILVVLAVGAGFGLVNAFAVVCLQVNSFIATLGVSTIIVGVSTAYSGGETISSGIPDGFTSIAQTTILGDLQMTVVYTLVACVVLWIVFGLSATGRRMTAVGGNAEAARLVGIRVNRMVAVGFVVSGLLAAVAGILLASNLGSGDPSLGPSYLLPAYAGAFLGATSIQPGRFNVWGTVVAVYLLAATVNGLQQMGAADWVESIFNGTALVLAVAFSGYLVRQDKHRGAVKTEE